MKAMRIVSLMIVIFALFGSVLPSKADDGEESPWGEILNPDGTIQWDNLSDLGTTTEGADWMDVSLPGGVVIDLDASYHRYLTPSGNVLVLPSPATLFFMALNPEESGLSDAQSMLGNGASILALLVGPSLSAEQLAELASNGYTNPADFFQAVINGEEDIWSLVNAGFLFDLLEMSFDSGFLVNALLLYINSEETCEAIPGGCPENPNCPEGSCSPSLLACPASSFTQQPYSLTIQKVAPENPLVVGQDPEKRGADIQVAVTIPPVILTWYEPIQDPPTCEYDPDGEGLGCPRPGGQYDAVINANGDSIDWTESMEGNRFWEYVDGDTQCIEHIEIVPEPINSIQANASLSPQSRSWILDDLAGKYYEAYLHQPEFNLLPGMTQVPSGCDGSGACSATGLIANIPFADPGTFNLELWVYTAGAVFIRNEMAFPLTPPRVLFEQSSLQVYVTLVTLIPGDAP